MATVFLLLTEIEITWLSDRSPVPFTEGMELFAVNETSFNVVLKFAANSKFHKNIGNC